MEDLNPIFYNHIGIFPKVIDNKYCDELINLINNQKPHPQMYRNYIDEGSAITVKDKAISIAHQYPKLANDFTDKILKPKILSLYINKYTGYQDIFLSYKILFNGFNVQQTTPGQGYHKWHSEWYPIPSGINRILVWTLYLNDVEEGGETEFLDIPFRVKPQKGTVCIFPSFPTHFHRGNPPLSNNKYIATGWVEALDPNNSLPKTKNE